MAILYGWLLAHPETEIIRGTLSLNSTPAASRVGHARVAKASGCCLAAAHDRTMRVAIGAEISHLFDIKVHGRNTLRLHVCSQMALRER